MNNKKEKKPIKIICPHCHKSVSFESLKGRVRERVYSLRSAQRPKHQGATAFTVWTEASKYSNPFSVTDIANVSHLSNITVRVLFRDWVEAGILKTVGYRTKVAFHNCPKCEKPISTYQILGKIKSERKRTSAIKNLAQIKENPKTPVVADRIWGALTREFNDSWFTCRDLAAKCGEGTSYNTIRELCSRWANNGILEKKSSGAPAPASYRLKSS